MANEVVSTQGVAAQFDGMSRLPWLRQIGLLVGLAASVAVGVAVVLWSQSPNYGLLYGNLTDKDAAQVVQALQAANLPFKVDHATGAVMVPKQHLHDARLKLAADGLPKGANVGFEIMQEQGGFGTSQFLEGARYQRAMEGELARSIMTLRSVQAARVHLAIPRPSVFVRDRQQPTASVVLNLYPGRNLDESQVASVIHLVASSVPNLDTQKVTVVDQQGRLLTSQRSDGMGLNTAQFDYARRMEQGYIKRIEDILTPIIGPGGVRAQVALDLDFTITEQTEENFIPDPAALRSEHIVEEQRGSGASALGIPGALSNEPPGPSSAPETTAATSEGAASETGDGVAQTTNGSSVNRRRRSTRNYELDKSISHVRTAPGQVRRLSAAVVVDHRQALNEDGEVELKPLTPEEIERATALVKEAVGFNTERGDSVQVINASFTRPPKAEPLPEPPIWQQPWVWDIGKQVLGGLVVLFIIFGVLRPTLRGLATRPEVPAASVEGLQAFPAAGMPGHPQPGLPGQAQAGLLPPPSDYNNQLQAAKEIATQDPRLTAQVVKNWVATDA